MEKNPAVTKTEVQLSWEWPDGTGRWQAGHKPAACPGSKGLLGCVSRNTAGRLRRVIFPLSSALVILHLPSCIQFWFPNRKTRTVTWSEFSRGPPNWLGAEALALWGEAVLTAAPSTYREVIKKTKWSFSHCEKVTRYKEKLFFPRGQSATAKGCPERLFNLHSQGFSRFNCINPWATCSDLSC